MMSIIGRGLILIAVVAAGFGVVTGLVGGAKKGATARVWTARAALLFAAAMIFANLTMLVALLSHDFSVSYVAKVGSLSTPAWVTAVSLWSSLEGSILFWGAVLGVFVALFVRLEGERHKEYATLALGTMLLVGAFFGLLLAGPADPFAPVYPVPPDGPGPNPLLQNHILMVAHPPALYLGFVGLTVPFAMAMAAILRGRLADSWLASLRRFLLVPWIFLTVGIVLGGWWAYEVLGWGGYWAWDPVENASLMPWLVATAYLHSSFVFERRRVLTVWSLGLVLAAFTLTLLGTFMTRSGIFNSVHAFSQSAIGPAFLVFLAGIILFSIGALAGRAHLLTGEGHYQGLVSRETALLAGNVVLITFAFTVLLGTVYPLVTEAVRGVKLSVGEPYFDKMAIPLGLTMVLLMAIAPVLPWGRPTFGRVARELAVPAAGGLFAVAAAFVAHAHKPLWLATVFVAAVALVVSAKQIAAPLVARVRQKREKLPVALGRALALHRRRIGAYVAHLGVLFIVVAVAASNAYKQTAEASLTTGQSFVLDHYTLKFERLLAEDEPHRFGVVAVLAVERDGTPIGVITPRLNIYATQREPVGSPAVRSSVREDLYVSLMSYEDDGSRIVVKAFVNPLVPWIWWSLGLLVAGGLLALWPRRRAAAAEERASDEATAKAAKKVRIEA